MKKIYVKDIINICNGKLIIGNADIECNNFCKDTRILKENDIYIGIKGETFDGNLFYKEAFDKGASVCLLDNIDNIDVSKYKDKTIIYVSDTINAIQELAIYKRSLYDIPVIAITGSVGKTSTKDTIASVISTKYKVLKTEGNYNNHIGVPLTILRLKDEEVLVVEMGMNNIKELSVLTNIAKPTIAVITNVGTAHIGNLGSRENILKAKLEILEGLTKEGMLVINNDNDLLHNELSKLKEKYKVTTIGINNISDYMAINIKNEGFSSSFEVNNNKINLLIGGIPFIYNSVMAYSIGKYLNISDEDIIKGIEGLKLTNNRMDIKKNKRGVTIVDDTYNANYDSMVSAIELLGKSNQRKITVLGDMLELGDYSEDIHRKIGLSVTKNKIDILITVGEYSKYIKEEAINNNFNKNNIYSFNSQEETYKLLDKILKKDDIILLKASHSMNFIKIVEEIMKFD